MFFFVSDVLGSAKGWAASLLFHPSLKRQLQEFFARLDTFSLGVCNGCQLMSLLGWIGNSDDGKFIKSCFEWSNKEVYNILFLGKPNIFLAQNNSERFECRWSTVKIEKSPSIMLNGMEGTVFGIWVAHGEGKFTFRNYKTLTALKDNNCFAIKYTDDRGVPTEKYPMNPNGSYGKDNFVELS